MPAWAGRWKGGRYYLDAESGKRVFFIERRGRSVRLDTHDEDLAVGQLAAFLADPVAFTRPPPEPEDRAPVFITQDRLTLYMESIRDTVLDHRKARRAYLHAWSELGLDLRTVDRKTLRAKLTDFPGGHRGRTEALNAFARFLVKEGDLPTWNPLVNTREAEATRAARVAYDVETIRRAFKRLDPGLVRDLFQVRVATGMHHTEIEQLAGAPVQTAPLGDQGAAIRTLGKGQKIAGVLQVMHKSRHRHRQSVDAVTLASVLRLRERVPDRITVWEKLKAVGIVPSNLRHTFATLAGEVGELVTFKSGGVDRSRVAQALGHRAGSTMTADRYEKIQVPPMIRLPIRW